MKLIQASEARQAALETEIADAIAGRADRLAIAEARLEQYNADLQAHIAH